MFIIGKYNYICRILRKHDNFKLKEYGRKKSQPAGPAESE